MFTSLMFSLMLQGSYYNQFFEELSRHVGPQLIEEQILFQHQNISFQHQHWRIRKDTLCRHHTINKRAARACRASAETFFVEACQALGQHMFEDLRYTKPRNMFCIAANQQPVDGPDPDLVREQEIAELQKRCKELVDATTLRYNPKALKQRKKVCSDYRRATAIN